MPDAAALIQLEDVHYAPGGVPVLHGITLSTDARRIGIVGRNGSGKTSLARVLTGLVAASEGTVRIAGVDVAADRKAALGLVGILFQNPDHQIIFPTVEEEIAFGLTQMGQSRDQAARGVSDILAQFGKSHWATSAVHPLSQGQRQLVCLMSVLAMQPKVIVLDEPFAGLDIPTTMQLQRMLDALEVTLVLITHQPSVLAGYDRVLWIDDGRIAQDGPAGEVIAAFEARMQQIGGGDDLSDLSG